MKGRKENHEEREREKKREEINGELLTKLSKINPERNLNFAKNFIFIYLRIYVTGRMLRIHFEYLLLRIVIWAIWKRMKYADTIHSSHLRRYAQ